ncbi:hypothetical protein PHISCL_08148 [Aspergillus sclerotialis]|uniref:Haloacid dehalogenase-like hydrolase n=1 Tax=Aspergillus sclerotialis TaxID=2070753 RepID=A0A3A2ZJI0_9EURO|nr:hypothetical protein PHISCL_08148 [Aspergillus sclerotialis]
MPLRPPNLLLTLDAFETIFYPRQPVPVQYAQTAHAYGLPPSIITPESLKASFKKTFKTLSATRPNYGRADALQGKYGGPRQWWEEVIRGSFGDILSHTEGTTGGKGEVKLPDGMVNALLERFASKEGYELYPDVRPFFRRMQDLKMNMRREGGGGFDNLVIGVVSNSDDRVPDILKSLGLRVGKTRADRDVVSTRLPGFEERSSPSSSSIPTSDSQSQSQSQWHGQEINDIDLVITSYDAGAEKPSPLIFEVAKRQAQSLVPDSIGEWACVHVGDHYEKDYQAAIDAGWDGIFLPREDGQVVEGAKSVNSLGELVDVLEGYSK